VAERSDGLAVREDDAEPEPLEDENIVLADGDVVAMAVSGYRTQLLMRYGCLLFFSDILVAFGVFPSPGATVVVADICCWSCHTERGRGSGYKD
jgi:hypothetical protein